MKNLVSKQHTNDGGYHIKRLVNEANSRLKQEGKQGKRATIVVKKTSLSLQFTFHDGNGNPQKNVGLGGILVSPNGILEAEKIARLVTAQLMVNTFTWDWFYALIGKPTSEQNKQLTCKEMVKQYKEHFLKQRKENKNPENNWYRSCRYIEKILGSLNKPLSLSLVRQIAESTDNNTDARKDTLNGLVGFLKYFDNDDYKKVIRDYKDSSKIKRKKRNVPSDQKIVEVYAKGFLPSNVCNKRFLYRYPQWQFLYGLLATYGLRVHEAWNIANWDKAVTLKNGDWVTVEADDDNQAKTQRNNGDFNIPAILDPTNKEYFLCIKNDTKTGYRIVVPLSPDSHNWLEDFNLLQPLNLPDIENPLKKIGKNKTSYSCTNLACQRFRKGGYGFTPHDLRHAYNHRGHRLGINIDALCQSLGHSMQINTTVYRDSQSEQVKYSNLQDAVSKNNQRRSENELFKEENKALKAENTALKQEIEVLKTKLQMYEAIKESKDKN